MRARTDRVAKTSVAWPPKRRLALATVERRPGYDGARRLDAISAREAGARGGAGGGRRRLGRTRASGGCRGTHRALTAARRPARRAGAGGRVGAGRGRRRSGAGGPAGTAPG